MEKEQADTIIEAARGLGASEVYVRGGRVHVHLTKYNRFQEQVGDLHMVVGRNRSTIRDFSHSPNLEGVAFSRMTAKALAELDSIRAQAC